MCICITAFFGIALAYCCHTCWCCRAVKNAFLWVQIWSHYKLDGRAGSQLPSEDSSNLIVTLPDARHLGYFDIFDMQYCSVLSNSDYSRRILQSGDSNSTENMYTNIWTFFARCSVNIQWECRSSVFWRWLRSNQNICRIFIWKICSIKPILYTLNN